MKILVKTLDPNSPAALCRVNSFLTIHGATTKITDRPGWQDLLDADLLVVHRPVHPDDLSIIKLAKLSNKMVWTDADDDYFNVPKDHFCYNFYNCDKKKELISECLRLSDVVTISNELLKESFGHLNKNMHTVVCSYPDGIIKFKNKPKQNKKICWRGSQTHRRSLMEFGPAIVAASKRHPDWEWHFIGDMPWTFIDDLQGRVFTTSDGLEPHDLWTTLFAISPSIQIAPLHGDHFTMCRSNMAWMDGLCGGAVTIAPDWDHWRVPGVLNYGAWDFGGELCRTMRRIENDEKFDALIESAWQHLENNYTFSAINKIQRNIIASAALST